MSWKSRAGAVAQKCGLVERDPVRSREVLQICDYSENPSVVAVHDMPAVVEHRPGNKAFERLQIRVDAIEKRFFSLNRMGRHGNDCWLAASCG